MQAKNVLEGIEKAVYAKRRDAWDNSNNTIAS